MMEGKYVTFHSNFRVFMTTEIENPFYLPQVYNKVLIIDFTLGEKGLSEQLVSAVVEIERLDLFYQSYNFIGSILLFLH